MMRIQNLSKIIYPELSYKLTGLCYEVQGQLGRFCSEKQYADALEVLLKKSGLVFQREKFISIKFGEESIQGMFPDFLVENSIVLDLKAKKFITKDDYNQMMKYLHLLNKKLGLIVNFRSTYLKPKRILNSQYLHD
jgi:GxxExxY protein